MFSLLFVCEKELTHALAGVSEFFVLINDY